MFDTTIFNQIIIFFAQHLFWVSLIAYFGFTLYLGKKKSVLIPFLLLSSLVFSGTFLLSRLLSFFIKIPRPFVVDSINPLFPHVIDNGFPSDHTLLTATIAASVFVFNKKLGSLLFVLTAFVGLARVIAGVHHISDIVGAIIISILIANLVYSAIQNINQTKFKTLNQLILSSRKIINRPTRSP